MSRIIKIIAVDSEGTLLDEEEINLEDNLNILSVRGRNSYDEKSSEEVELFIGFNIEYETPVKRPEE